jgi:hypothetical protein
MSAGASSSLSGSIGTIVGLSPLASPFRSFAAAASCPFNASRLEVRQPLSGHDSRADCNKCSDALDADISLSCVTNVTTRSTDTQNADALIINAVHAGQESGCGFNIFDTLGWIFQMARIPLTLPLISSTISESNEALLSWEFGV